MNGVDLVVDLNAQDDDAQIRFAILASSVVKNRHLLDRTGICDQP